ncbi:MAG: hypothetical protein GY716_13175 [bacterium]|nr:hypothetical protein [bacterium]
MAATDDDLLRLHESVDREAEGLEALHVERLRCASGCASCCVDGLAVFEVEADRIRSEHAGLLRDGRPHPAGSCAFLDDTDRCRIYRSRPYVCRTQGLPLRWFDSSAGGEIAELRDICPLNDECGDPIESLPEDACWLIGPYEGRLAALDSRRGPGRSGRVELRSLFENPADET